MPRIRPLLPCLLVALAASACGPRGASSAAPTAGPRDDGGRSARTFDRLEDEILHDLAAIDRRLALRAHLEPSEDDLRRVAMTAALREDPTVAVVAGSIDPFSFDARARGLDAAKKKVASLPADGARPSERELLARLVDAETRRLDEERALPRSASALVRAIVETWQAPKTERETADDDRWLARRLRDVREAMAASADPSLALDVVRARDLDDALDALEHLASSPGFTATTQELVRVRDALEAAASAPAAKARSDWSAVSGRLAAHLGVTAAPEEIARAFASLETDLRAKAERALATAGLGRDAIAASVEKQMFASGRCVDAVPASRVRSMAAPKEREPACHLRHLVANAEDAALLAVALAAMHDHLVVAEWALDVARGASTIAETQGKHRLLALVSPATRAHYERVALARPVAAIGTGQTASLLMAGDPKALAKAWSAVGDVPFDVAANELGGDSTRAR